MKKFAVTAALSFALAGCGGTKRSVPAAGLSATTASPSSTTVSSPSAATASPTDTTPAPAVRLAHGFRLTSPAFADGAAIPGQYTCDGADTPIPLKWSGVPRLAKELVLVMRDPDAPSGDFVHWAVAGIAPHSATVTGVEGRNSFGGIGYRGPCPPAGHAHHYVITLSALAGSSALKPGFAPDQLRTAAVGIATLVGTYSRR